MITLHCIAVSLYLYISIHTDICELVNPAGTCHDWLSHDLSSWASMWLQPADRSTGPQLNNPLIYVVRNGGCGETQSNMFSLSCKLQQPNILTNHETSRIESILKPKQHSGCPPPEKSELQSLLPLFWWLWRIKSSKQHCHVKYFTF